MKRSDRQAMLSRRRFLRMAAVGTGGALLAACGAPQVATPAASDAPTAGSAPAITAAPAVISGNPTITVMILAKELPEEAIKQFNAIYPNIKINVVESDTTRLFAMYAAGNPPDVVRVQAPSIPQLLARKLLLDLTPYFQSSELLKIDDLGPANQYYKANGPTQIGEGQIYGMARDWSPDFTLWANKAAFEDGGVPLPDEKTPLTYQQIDEIARKLTKMEGDRVARWGYGYGDFWIDRIWMNMLAETGKSLYADDYTRIDLVNNGEARKIAQYYFDLAKDKVVASPISPSPSWNGDDFTKGNLALLQYGYWYSGMAEGDTTKGNVVMLPAPTWAGERRDPTMTATGFVITQGSKNPDAAWKFFEWYLGSERMVEQAKQGGGIPSLKSMYQYMPNETPFEKQVQRVLQEELQYANKPLQFNPFLGESTVVDSWNKNLDQALKGTISFDDLLTNVEAEVNMAIKEGIDRIG